MKKFIVHSSWFIVMFLLLFPITMNQLPLTIYAADSTPSADLRAKLDELKKEIASKAANLKQELKGKLENKAYVGSIKSYSSSSLNLDSEKGPKVVNFNQDTLFVSQIRSKKDFSPKTFSKDLYIAALGDVDETQSLTARKIILLPKPKPETKTNIWGKVISADGKLVTIQDRNLQNIALSLTIDISLKTGDFVIATGVKNDKDIFQAGFVYVIPQGGVIKPKKVATPSAQVATKSASPSGTKK